MFLSPCFIPLLCTGEPCASRERQREIALSLSLSRAIFFFFDSLKSTPMLFFFIVNNAFSLHAHPGLTLCWKHFMKMWSCLKLKLISKLKSLGRLHQPHPFSLFSLICRRCFTELIEIVLIFCASLFFFSFLYFSNPKLHQMRYYWISGAW